ncbi:MAG: sigma-54-dependent Fis family transcriptional regulator [Desulfobacteraceae bacterium]|nr:sigma-54-dependent Fis family transcriptional regulator [Desulfobacteraceae bacterium]
MSDVPLIIAADDDPDFLNGIIRILRSRFSEFEIEGVSSGSGVLKLLEKKDAGILISDLRMPEMSGMELLENVLDINPDICVIMLTGYATVEAAVEALKKGAWDFISKPVEREELFHAVEKACAHYRLAKENRKLKNLVKLYDKNGSSFASPAMKAVREKAAAVASAEYTVLITGESGSGKEYIAKEIHKMSGRKDNVLNSINCTAIPEQLLESELFGHVKGAFTGAEKNRRGIFQASDKGTIILDEIGDITHSTQVRLLKFLQDKEVKPLGSSDSKKVDVRIIALTNQNLEDLIRKGKFREDLYYRLNVLSIEVPPLRKRKEDIPFLSKFFLDQAAKDLGMKTIEMDYEVISHISSMPWYGNVRELQNFMRRLAVFSGGKKIDFKLINIVEGNGSKSGEITQTEFKKYKDAKKEIVDSFSRKYLTDLLEKTSGNISMVSRLSGLERVSVQKIIKRLDIDVNEFRKVF